MHVTFSNHTWALIVVMFVLNLAVLSGMIGGIVPDVARLVVSILALIAIGIDWKRSRQR